jgi:RND family efflux transporter MFP subunit
MPPADAGPPPGALRAATTTLKVRRQLIQLIDRLRLPVIVLAACSAAIAHAQQGDGPPPAPVRVAQAAMAEMAPIVWMPGTVVGRNDARVSAEVDGRLKSILDVGTDVAEGDEVARIDDTELKLALNEAEAVVARENARFRFAEQELARMEKLLADALITRSQVDQARTSRDAARNEWRAAKARLDLVRDRLGKTRLKAPFAGVVTERYQRAGERVEAGTEVLRLVDPDNLEVQVFVSAATLPNLPAGASAQLKANGESAEGTVSSIVNVGDDRSRLYDARLAFAKPGWPAGTTLRVAVPIAASREVVAVPRDALVLRRDGTSVFRIKEDGTAERVQVTTGVANGALIEVSGDIKPGDRVVIRGGDRLFPGQKVQIQEG